MMRYDLPEGAWRKSSYSPDNGGQCIETQPTPDGLVALGDSKNRSLGAFIFGPAAWETFIESVKDGQFDQ